MANPIPLSGSKDNSRIEELIHTAATEENCDVEISLNMHGATFEIFGLTVQMNNNNNNNNKSMDTSQGGKVTMLWKQQVQTYRTISNNKSDIIIRDNEK